MLLEFRANQLQYGPAEKPDFCPTCGMDDTHRGGMTCGTCGSWTCQSCLETRKYGRVMELLEACPVCLEARMEALAEGVAALAEFERLMAARVADEIMEGR